MKLRLCILAALCVGLFTAAPPALADDPGGPERQYLVAGNTSALPTRAAIEAAGGTWTGEITSIGVAIARSSNPEFLALVETDPSVALASPDFEVGEIPEGDASVAEPDLTASAGVQEAGDPFSNLQWPHLAMGGIAQAHARGITGRGVRVAVVDSGIDCLHEDLRDRCVPGISFVPLADGSGFEDPWDATKTHGTEMAGVIAATANNGKGVRGVAPEATLISVKVSPSNGANFPWSRGAQGIDWASSVGRADIINVSWVARLRTTDPENRREISEFLGIANRLLALVFRRGVVVVAAAGNNDGNVAEQPELRLWPARDGPRALTIGSIGPCGAALNGNVFDDFYDNHSIFSNYGFDQTESRFLVFPGGQVQRGCDLTRGKNCQVGLISNRCAVFDLVATTTARGTVFGGYTFTSGTSAATAQASGLAALVLSAHPDMKPGQLVDTIMDTTVDIGAPGYDPLFGYGRGDVSAALR
jgi:subtilisin family serine protease